MWNELKREKMSTLVTVHAFAKYNSKAAAVYRAFSKCDSH